VKRRASLPTIKLPLAVFTAAEIKVPSRFTYIVLFHRLSEAGRRLMIRVRDQGVVPM